MLVARSKTENWAQVVDLGVVGYMPALKLQHRLVQQRQRGEIPDTLLLLEHPATITLGKNGTPGDLREGQDGLVRRGVKLHQVERGGKATAHEPGQLVSYFIFRVPPEFGIRKFVRCLEEAASAMLAEWDIIAWGDEDNPGVWITNRKIAAIGLAVSRRITSHGMAINVANDLDVFRLISPCGMDNVEMTSMVKETGCTPSMAQVKQRLAHHLGMVLNVRFEIGQLPE
jgi:lipoate-protein ligase B